MTIYATSDTHFSHEKLKTMGAGRPDNYEELILAGIRKLQGDILLHLGDISIGNDEKNLKRFMEAAHGFKKVILVRGNHDGKSYSWYMERGFSHVCEIMQMRLWGKEILFTHMPFKRSGYQPSPYYSPVRHFHGHLHGNGNRHAAKELYDPEYHYDVAPDTHDYRPVNIEEVIIKNILSKMRV